MVVKKKNKMIEIYKEKAKLLINLLNKKENKKEQVINALEKINIIINE